MIILHVGCRRVRLRLGEALHMEETTLQIEAVHPQPPAHHPHPHDHYHHSIESLAAKRHNRRGLMVYRAIPTGGAEGEAFNQSRFGSRSGLCQLFDVWFPADP